MYVSAIKSKNLLCPNEQYDRPCQRFLQQNPFFICSTVRLGKSNLIFVWPKHTLYFFSHHIVRLKLKSHAKGERPERPGTPRKLLFRYGRKTQAFRDDRSGFKRDCARVDTQYVSSVVADALDASWIQGGPCKTLISPQKTQRGVLHMHRARALLFKRSLRATQTTPGDPHDSCRRSRRPRDVQTLARPPWTRRAAPHSSI